MSLFGWCAGACVLCLLFVSACSVCPCVLGVVWSVCVLCGVLWCCGFVLAFGCCCFLFLPRLLCAFLLLLCGVTSVWPVFSPGFVLPLVLPFPSVGQCSAGPFLRVSGCICDGPVVMPVVWSVVTAWLLSSLLLMATKASALCGVLPSTPCCGCCSRALLSCTEVFTLG